LTRLKLEKKGRTGMASKSKKKTTMAKLNREAAVRERRVLKAAKKEARRLDAASPSSPPEADRPMAADDDVSVTIGPLGGQPNR
jgi:hypothetical protein